MDAMETAYRADAAGRKIILASRTGARLDSHVTEGGGTDDTAALQAVLDQAPALGGLYLIMDGAALVTGLRVHSNTTIHCLNQDCGFYQAAQSNCAVLTNADWDFAGIHNRNITLIGGTYNQNCAQQEHHVTVDDTAPMYMYSGLPGSVHPVYLLEFYGVENLLMRDVVLRDQRTHALVAANWRHVVMENIRIDLPGRMHAQNQDGLHFFGPGQFLTLRDIRGRSGDDFIALAPDEIDCRSDITDVLIDGVFLDDADQGIRMLSRDTGRLDRVTVRNMTGTYRSFGFYINPWYRGGKYGNYGHITFENIDLRQSAPNYDYTTPFLFRIGGNVESLVFRNIVSHLPADDRPLIELGWPVDGPESLRDDYAFGSVLVDGLRILTDSSSAPVREAIRARCRVGHLTLRNVEVYQEGRSPTGSLLHVTEDGEVDTLLLQNMMVRGLQTVVRSDGGTLRDLAASGVFCASLPGGLMECAGGAAVETQDIRP